MERFNKSAGRLSGHGFVCAPCSAGLSCCQVCGMWVVPEDRPHPSHTFSRISSKNFKKLKTLKTHVFLEFVHSLLIGIKVTCQSSPSWKHILYWLALDDTV
jgi:hypothetical protein